jgi:hypothetical protein
MDALKLFNTDFNVPNIYTVTSTGRKLSINGISPIYDNYRRIPLGLKLNKTGNIDIKISDVDESLSHFKIYFSDILTGTEHELLRGKEITIQLGSGEYLNRFFLDISSLTTGNDENSHEKSMFNIYTTGRILKAEIKSLQGKEGTLFLYNLTGQILFLRKISQEGYYEFSPGVQDGIYIASFINGTRRISKKIIICN